ncbi:endolytic transglycosylase MltG [Gardnerella vaginalis]|uniref:endolytic transglycosylase MltG n=1 Tax=Gardnerella vaginalis TaxID=2702 RepID=UPI000353682B|nr:endolytic transglycosylase MltG [Gardnerella vaginalis]EPI56942.1 YceG family protein [Gardnerella vaginalis JCP7275]
MTENIDDFFDQNAKWSHETPNPPVPPKSRKDLKAQKRRKSKRKRIIAFILTLIFAILFVLGYGLYRVAVYIKTNNQSTIMDDWPGPGSGFVEFTIEPGQGSVEVGNNLVKAQVVKSQSTFSNIVAANNKILYPGIYALKKHMNSIDVVNILSDQSKAGGFLDVKAGERSTDVIRKAAQISGIDITQFKEIENAGGMGVLPPEACGSFEGWLEPGVYNVKSMKSATKILAKMVDKRIQKLDSLGVPKGKLRQDILKIASIAEAEVNNREYYGKVSRVILNRLAKDMPLGMDTTVAYGIGIKAINLTQAQLDDVSNPYNTRIHKGLPPTPISIPGDNAILASLNPEKGSWIYFVTTNLKTGETKFADNYDDFLKIRDEYKRSNENAN